MKKKFMVIVTVFTMLFAVQVLNSFWGHNGSAITASAATNGDYQYVILDDGTVEITAYSGTEATLEIPTIIEGKRVTSIGYEGFSGCSNLVTVHIPEGITTIGIEAFIDCTNLYNIIIPESVTSIDHTSFYNTAWYNTRTNGLLYLGVWCLDYKGSVTSEVTIADGIERIAARLFINNTTLTKITFPSGIKSTGDLVCSGCTALTNITFSGSALSIGTQAFYECSALTAVRIPASVTSIGTIAFRNCISLSSVIIEEGNLKRIGEMAFSGCTTLPEITIPNSVTSLGDAVFVNTPWSNNLPPGIIYKNGWVLGYNGSTTSDTIVAIKDGTKGIADKAFYFQFNITTIAIPEGIKTIPSSAFFNCKKLQTINIPESVTRIEEKSFAYCPILSSVHIPANVVSIGKYAFGYNGPDSNIYNKIDGFKIYCDAGSAGNAYAIDNVFDYSASILKCKVTIPDTTYIYNGATQNPKVTVTYGTNIMDSDTVYSVFYSDNIIPGIATVTITGKGNYYGSLTNRYKINAKPISGLTAALSSAAFTFDGTAKNPGVTITDGTYTLKKETDYIVAYGNNITAGVAAVTITGTNNYTGTLVLPYTINAAAILQPNTQPIPPTTMEPAKIVFTEKKVTLGVGEFFILIAKMTPANANETIIYTSNKPSVAKVNKTTGKIKAVKIGTAIITAKTSKGIKTTCNVTIKKSPTKISIAKKTVTLKKGKTYQIKYTLPTNSASKKITFTTTNKAVASVDSKGTVKAKKKGFTIITIKTYNGKKTTIKVNVSN